MSAHEMKNKFDEARRLGAVECLNKPLNLDALGDAVKNMTNKGTKTKICIVDDNRAVCEVMQDVLTRNGYEVDVAYSGNEVIGDCSSSRRFPTK
jgi:CheY-like chemotaxis protein